MDAASQLPLVAAFFGCVTFVAVRMLCWLAARPTWVGHVLGIVAGLIIFAIIMATG